MLTIGTTCCDTGGTRSLTKAEASPSGWTHSNVSFEDTIDLISDPLSSMDSITPLVALLAICYQSNPIPDRTTAPSTPIAATRPSLLSTIPTHRPDRLSNLMNALAQTHACRTHRHEEMHNSFIRFLTPVLSGMAGLTDFQEAAKHLSGADDMADFWRFQGRNLLRDVVMGNGAGWGGGGGNGGGGAGSELPFVDVFVGDPTCRIALTRDRRRLVLVSGDSMPGDAVFSATQSRL